MTRRGGDQPGADLRPHTLYRLFDVEEQLLYVGVTCQIDVRLYQHSLYSNWWPLVHTDTRVEFSDRFSALTAEKAAVVAEGPMFNVVHAARLPAPRLSPSDERDALHRYLRDYLRVPITQARQAAYGGRRSDPS